MATLSPFCLYSPWPLTLSQSSHSILHPKHCLLLISTSRHKTLRLHSNSNSNSNSNNNNNSDKQLDTNEPNTTSRRFLNEDGVVEDMDGYLNYLSLEYDSVWDTKPSWCQPWTITLTGASVVAGSWLVLHNILATSLASIVIGAWWYIFLYSYPKAYTEMIAERRKKVTSGVEDTFGLRNSP